MNDIIENTLEYAISHSNSEISLSSKWNDKLDFVRFLSQMAVNFLKTTDVKKNLIEISKNLEILFDFLLRKVFLKSFFGNYLKNFFFLLKAKDKFCCA